MKKNKNKEKKKPTTNKISFINLPLEGTPQRRLNMEYGVLKRKHKDKMRIREENHN